MINTSTALRNKSEALKNGIGQLVQELKKTNDEIATQLQINENSVEQHHKDIEQLGKDNEALAVLRADNETFISKVEEILAE